MVDALEACKTEKPGGFGLGLDNTNAATMLRRLADEIEGDALALQKVDVHEVASIDDYCLTTLTIQYADRIVSEKLAAVRRSRGDDAAKALYGTGLFPLAWPENE